MQNIINKLAKLFIPKILVYACLLTYIFIFYKVTFSKGYYWGSIIAIFPFLLIIAFLLFKNPLTDFIFVFIANYFVMGAMRYIYFPGGVCMDILISFCFTALIVKSTYKKIEWRRCINPLTLLTFIWLFFCLLELLNPKGVLSDWASGVRGMAVYPFVMVVLVSVLCHKYKDLKLILIIWAVLTLLAAFKGYWQKNHGFDYAELQWLYTYGGRTHLIRSGIRYFSFFTDAGNYGSSMGFSAVVFLISTFYLKNKWLKIFFFIASLSGFFGMFISGTRGAIAVPFAGFALFIILSKNWKIATSTTIILALAFFFLNFTNIGNDNRYLRRMRTAFDTNDASLNVRLENQKKLRTYMADIPFGTSIGFYAKVVDSSHPFYEISKIPSDSWYVQVWIQTGIVGLVLHIILLSAAILFAGYIILFQIRNKELKGILAAMLAGTFGMLVSSYGNSLLGQFPNSFIFYICQAFVFMGKYYDKELQEHEKLT